MTHPLPLTAALAALLLAQPAAAQEVDCEAAEVQMELTFCAEQDWNAADKALNVTYKAARDVMRNIDAGLPEARRGAEMQLRDAQRAWVTFRDATCSAEGYAYHGGSIEPMVIYACRARLTWQRAEDLDAIAVTY
ncbi:lysozyme inhibitor LprI family protein [Paracoccaceae bacterium Fryx2]|nr:lysozyme inhibitor LprI family protein [Paracoccaceae bacterium Fryx2]